MIIKRKRRHHGHNESYGDLQKDEKKKEELINIRVNSRGWIWEDYFDDLQKDEKKKRGAN